MTRIHRKKPAHSSVQHRSEYRAYKDNLVADFNKSCGYCDCPDTVWGGKRGFQIDHFAPKSQFPELQSEYQNLIYSCPLCNRAKSNLWPSKDSSISYIGNIGFVHPCEAEYDVHLERNDRGAIVALTPLGEYIKRTMKLYLMRHEVIWLRQELMILIEEVGQLITISSSLNKKYIELCKEYFRYDKLLKEMMDD